MKFLFHPHFIISIIFFRAIFAAYPVSVSGMITVPAMYQAVVANISQIQGQNDASVQVHPSAQMCI